MDILNRVFDIRLQRIAIFALVKDIKKTVGFDVSNEQWHYYFFLMAYDKHFRLSKIPKALHQPNWQYGNKHALGSPAGNNSLTNFKSNEKHF